MFQFYVGLLFTKVITDKKQTYVKTEGCKLYSISNISAKCHQSVDPYNFEKYRFNVDAFF